MRRAVAVFLTAAVAALGVAAGRAASAPPPGATARCNDGTYSYSQTHSGTCSHHGGVAAWLDGSGATAGSSGTSAVGATVLLARRSASSGCARGPRPDRRCSPGAYYSRLTSSVICASSFRTAAIRDVPQSEKYAVEREYGMPARLYGRSIEIDHIVSLELGGSNNIANLFPEPGSGPADYRVKDRLENRLHELVCAGTITLRQAQTQIASNWELLYRHDFGVSPAG
jgi:Protein of unknown function (DUF3761)